MTRIEQPSGGHGSLKDIQLLVNTNTDIINKHIKETFADLINDTIIWQSPLENDDYAEYRDNDFIEKVGLNTQDVKLNEFWPIGGPQWDALAKTTEKRIILVEAKANIPEIVSPPTSAGQGSKNLIDKSLKETKEYLGIKNDIDWSSKFYQYTNRLAHLYFLRIRRDIPTYLLNIYFIGDESVSGPKTEAEWEAALKVMYLYLGISRHKLSKYMADIFIEVNELRK